MRLPTEKEKWKGNGCRTRRRLGETGGSVPGGSSACDEAGEWVTWHGIFDGYWSNLFCVKYTIRRNRPRTIYKCGRGNRSMTGGVIHEATVL